MLRIKSRREYRDLVVAWAIRKYDKEIVKAIKLDLKCLNSEWFPVYGYFNHAGILTTMGFDNNGYELFLHDIENSPPRASGKVDQLKLKMMEPDWALVIGSPEIFSPYHHNLYQKNKLIIGEKWPRFQKISEKFILTSSGSGKVSGDKFPPSLNSELSQRHLTGIGCGHYRLRREKTFPGVIGFTDLYPIERAIIDRENTPLVATICGHTAKCKGITLSYCESCFVIVCSDCEGHHEIQEQNGHHGLEDGISYCPSWGPLYDKNWVGYKYVRGGDFGHSGTVMNDSLEMLCIEKMTKKEKKKFDLERGLGFVYPAVRARVFLGPLFDKFWPTTHPVTKPNHGPGEIYSIHDEDCCGDDGCGDFFTFHKIKGL